MEKLTGHEIPGAAMTHAEAEEVVALWGKRMSELDEKASMPTTKDLAEALGVPPSQVAMMLDEVRRKNAPRAESLAAPAKKGLKPRHWAAIGLSGAFLSVAFAMFLFITYRGGTAEAVVVKTAPATVADSIRVEVPVPDFAMPSVEIAGLDRLERLKAWGEGFAGPLNWGSNKSLTAVIDGKSTSLDLKGEEEFFSSRILAEEITRLVQAGAKSASVKNAEDYLEKTSEIERSLSLGTSAGWENIYRFTEVKLEVGGKTELVKVPQLVMTKPTTGAEGSGLAAWESLRDTVLAEQVLRISKGIKSLNEKVGPKTSVTGPAKAPDADF